MDLGSFFTELSFLPCTILGCSPKGSSIRMNFETSKAICEHRLLV